MKEIQFIQNPQGPTLGVTTTKLLQIDGLTFKDLEKDGQLAPYADWRLPARERAADLARRLSIEEIAGLMLYSPHQMVPFRSGGPFVGTYKGKAFEESGAQDWELTDQQRAFVQDSHGRNILALHLKNGEVAARWSNEIQTLCEEMPHSIPANLCTDPRHSAKGGGAEFKSSDQGTSKWPDGLALGATFDENLARRFGRVVAEEYRALGLTTALAPQFDLGCEPRWMRTGDTYGADPELVMRMGRAYCEGLQDDPQAGDDGWGSHSVAAMAKHWPGGGSGEGGRDAHYGFGKYAVYPAGRQEDHLYPFLKGAFHLGGPTGCVAAVMPYYTVSTGFDPEGKKEGNSYNHALIHDLLRGKAGYEGILCTDWGITTDPLPEIDSFGSRCYGVEDLSEAERHLKLLENGIDQFGGNSEVAPILEAYRLGCQRKGEAAMRRLMEESALRILENVFRLGLFESPYLDPQRSSQVLACPDFVEEGFLAQLRSLVLLKNKGQVLPLKQGLKVYVPSRHIGRHRTFFRGWAEEADLPGASREVLEEFFQVVDSPQEADLALCFIESPINDGGYQEGEGYLPISLQYRPYTATHARKVSLAGGDFREEGENRSYQGKTATCPNESDLDLVLDARKAMGEKPVIVVLSLNNPCVVSELEGTADAILADFGVSRRAVLTLLTGGAKPEGRLPVILPASMEAVEEHPEDLPLGLEAHVDSEGHAYGFGFGLDFVGVLPAPEWKKES